MQISLSWAWSRFAAGAGADPRQTRTSIWSLTNRPSRRIMAAFTPPGCLLRAPAKAPCPLGVHHAGPPRERQGARYVDPCRRPAGKGRWDGRPKRNWVLNWPRTKPRPCCRTSLHRSGRPSRSALVRRALRRISRVCARPSVILVSRTPASAILIAALARNDAEGPQAPRTRRRVDRLPYISPLPTQPR